MFKNIENAETIANMMHVISEHRVFQRPNTAKALEIVSDYCMELLERQDCKEIIGSMKAFKEILHILGSFETPQDEQEMLDCIRAAEAELKG